MKRNEFWRYCILGSQRIRAYCVAKKIPFAIDKYFIDQLFHDQKFRCAVSGIPFEKPRSGKGKNPRHPFGPSLDRIKPDLGYVPGNLRLVCLIVNLAMANWGEKYLHELVLAMSTERFKNVA